MLVGPWCPPAQEPCSSALRTEGRGPSPRLPLAIKRSTPVPSLYAGAATAQDPTKGGAWVPASPCEPHPPATNAWIGLLQGNNFHRVQSLKCEVLPDTWAQAAPRVEGKQGAHQKGHRMVCGSNRVGSPEPVQTKEHLGDAPRTFPVAGGSVPRPATPQISATLPSTLTCFFIHSEKATSVMMTRQ